MFAELRISPSDKQRLPLRLLAHLGDAVFHLFERERQILNSSSARKLHRQSCLRVSATAQAQLLEQIKTHLTDEEMDIVRRARNLKPAGYKKSGQHAYRQATAFEALLGYLYLTNPTRLKQVLEWTLMDTPQGLNKQPIIKDKL